MKGIYGIRCIPANKWYIGQTICIYGRLRSHLRNLENKKKCNKYFARAFHMYGADAFEIHLLEENVPKDHLDHLEKHYMDLFKSSDNKHGYNICYFKPNLKPAYKESFHELAKKPKKFGLGDAQVMRELYKEGYDNPFIRKMYKCSISHMSQILGNHVLRDSSYRKPKPDEREPLTFEQRKLVDQDVMRGESLLWITNNRGINWRRLTKYVERKDTKHNTLILDMSTGVYYYTLVEASEAVGINSHLLYTWLVKHPHRNKTSLKLVQEVITKVKLKPIILDTHTGVFYESFKEAARVLSVAPRTITRWLTDLHQCNQSNLVLC